MAAFEMKFDSGNCNCDQTMTHFTVLRREEPTDAKKHLEEIQFSFFKRILFRNELTFDAI
jgi:hypothetical protein